MRDLRVPAPRRSVLAALSLAGMLGCWRPADETPRLFDPKALVPVSGVVTLNGEPLANAVVTFLPKTGIPGVAETDEAGRYELRTVRSRGVAPGEYKVAISYVVSPDGEPQGLAARNATYPSKAMLSAKEQLPVEYSDLFRTKQGATVTPRGGVAFNFDVKAAVPTAAKGARPRPEAAGEGEGAGEKKEAEKP
jgi:hypothetical protein